MESFKSLQELEGEDWGDPASAPTNLVARCLEARRVPLDQMSAEQCRLLLGQKIGVPFVVPVALRFVEKYLFEGGTMYPGALLANVLEQPSDFWHAHSSLWWDVREIVSEVENVRAQIESMAPAIRKFHELDVR